MDGAVFGAEVHSVRAFDQSHGVAVIHSERRQAKTTSAPVWTVVIKRAVRETYLGQVRSRRHRLLDGLHSADANFVDQIGTKEMCFAQTRIDPVVAQRARIGGLNQRLGGILNRGGIRGYAVAEEE